MEIRVNLICIVINCFLIICSTAKTFSLNKAIEAEERNKATVKSSKLSDNFLNTERFLPLGLNKPKIRDISSILSPLKYRKPFQIKSPFRSNTLKKHQKSLTFINQSKQPKRGLDNYEEINQNYIPLFKSLSIILDNILSSGSGEGIIPRYIYKRNPYKTFESNDVVCSCAVKSTTEPYLSESYEETAPLPIIVSSEIPTETTTPPSSTTTKTYHTADNNVRNLRRDKNVSILPPRNTTGIGRDLDGFHERRSTSHIGNDKEFIAGDNRNHEYDTGIGNVQTYTESSKRDTNSDSRHSSSGHRPRGLRPDGLQGRKDSDGKGNQIDEPVFEPDGNIEGHLTRYKGKNKFPNRRIEEESPALVPKSPTRLQRLEPQKAKVIQPKVEKDYASIEPYITSIKRIPIYNNQNASDNKRGRSKNETIMSNPHNKVVMIFDGYSVTRDVNGENKMSEKAIEIHT